MLGYELDWARFVRLALRHRSAPLMRLRLDEHPGAVPEAVRRGFAAFHAVSAARNAVMVGELAMLTRRFAAAGIAAALLKGPIVAELADGAQGLRTLSDVDLLVSDGQAPAALALLGGRGFRIAGRFEDNGQDDMLVRDADNLVIELHRRLYMQRELAFDVTLTDVADRLAHAPLAGQRIPVLPVEENLLYLASHGAKHGWSRLAWLSGFAGFVEHHAGDIDPARLAARAAELRCTRMLGLGAEMAEIAFNRPFPLELARRRGGWAHALLRDALREPDGLTAGTGEAVRLLALATQALSKPDGTSSRGGLAAIEAELPGAPPIRRWRRTAYMVAIGGDLREHLAESLFRPQPADVAFFARRRDARLFYAFARPLRLAMAALRRTLRR